MFDPPSHKAVQDKHNTLVSNETQGNLARQFGALFTSPNENKPVQESFKHEHGKNFQRVS